MDIIQIPCLQDNYAYLVTCPASGETAVVDPSEGPRIAKEVKDRGLRLTAIFNTHHHWDHSGGNEYLCDHFRDHFPKLRVYGARYDREHGRIPRQSDAVTEGDSVTLGKLRFTVLDIPGHTLGHIAYVGYGAVFCGDTLFSIGCGRLFEGDPEMMLRSLAKLRGLPDETRVYCGHEYTENNVRFAMGLEAESRALQEYAEKIKERRANGLATVPSRLGDEKILNPFLRWDDPALKAALGRPLADDVETFAKVRQLKDRF